MSHKRTHSSNDSGHVGHFSGSGSFSLGSDPTRTSTGTRIPINIGSHELGMTILFQFGIKETISVASDDPLEKI